MSVDAMSGRGVLIGRQDTHAASNRLHAFGMPKAAGR